MNQILNGQFLWQVLINISIDLSILFLIKKKLIKQLLKTIDTTFFYG